jgi:hypothetical protein
LRARHAAAAALLGLLAAACGETSVTQPPPSPTPAPRPLQACSGTSIPEPGFTADTARSGTLTLNRISLNGDVQAALLIDGYQTGERGVFSSVPTRPLPSASPPGAATTSAPEPSPTATPAPPLSTAPPGAGPDLLVNCDVVRFSRSDGGKRFVQAFRQYRLDANQQQVTAPTLGDRSVAFMDHDQGFLGYAIDNANGAEIGVGKGDLFWSVAVFGPHPTLDTALAILRSMMSGAG